MNSKGAIWRGRPMRLWLGLFAGALLVVNPLYLVGWSEWVQPGFFAELWESSDVGVGVFGLMFVASTVGAVALFKDTLKDFRSSGAMGTDSVACTVRPLFRVLSGLLGIVLAIATVMMVVLLARAGTGSEAIEVWMALLLVALALGSAVGGFVCCFAAALGRQPGWMCPGRRPEGDSKASSSRI